jgi:glycosyltransferase 2 family protein
MGKPISTPDVYGSSSHGKKNRKTLFLFLRLSFVLVLYVVLFYNVDIGKLRQHLTLIIIPSLFISAVLVTLQAAFCTFRWRKIALAHTKFVPRFWFSFWVYEENLFANQFLPSTLGGDVVRVLRWRSAGVPSVPAATSVFLDRLSGLNGAALVVILTIPFMGFVLGSPVNSIVTFTLAIVVLGGTAVGFIIVRWPILFEVFEYWPRVSRFVQSLRDNLNFDRMFVYAVVASIFGHVIGGLATFVIALALGIQVSFLTIVAVSSLSILVSMVPLSIAGWGLRELSFVKFLAPFGVSNEQALALGLLVGISLLLASSLGGIGLLANWSKPSSSDL